MVDFLLKKINLNEEELSKAVDKLFKKEVQFGKINNDSNVFGYIITRLPNIKNYKIWEYVDSDEIAGILWEYLPLNINQYLNVFESVVTTVGVFSLDKLMQDEGRNEIVSIIETGRIAMSKLPTLFSLVEGKYAKNKIILDYSTPNMVNLKFYCRNYPKPDISFIKKWYSIIDPQTLKGMLDWWDDIPELVRLYIEERGRGGYNRVKEVFFGSIERIRYEVLLVLVDHLKKRDIEYGLSVLEEKEDYTEKYKYSTELLHLYLRFRKDDVVKEKITSDEGDDYYESDSGLL